MSALDDMTWKDYGRRYQRDGETLMWPERWQPGSTAAEVEAALAKPIRRHVHPKPEPVPEPPMSLSVAARLLGITAAALLKRKRKFGWAAAMAMGGRHDRAAQ